MTNPLSIEEENALINLMWDMQSFEDEYYLKYTLKNKFFQICGFCMVHPKRDCSGHGCFLLRQGSVDVLRRRYNPK